MLVALIVKPRIIVKKLKLIKTKKANKQRIE